MISNDATPTDDQHNLLGFLTDTKKYSPTYSRQTTITNALVSHIVCDLMPFSRTESQYIRGLMSALDQCYQVPSHKHLVNSLLPEKTTLDQSYQVPSHKHVVNSLLPEKTTDFRSRPEDSEHHMEAFLVNLSPLE